MSHALAIRRQPISLAREVRQMRAAHALALGRGMVNAQMVGDPFIPENGSQLYRRACLYATMMAQRAGLIPEDASGYFASFDLATLTVRLSPDDADCQEDRRASEAIRPAGGAIECVVPGPLIEDTPAVLAIEGPAIEGE
jgi:hypothetical protein